MRLVRDDEMLLKSQDHEFLLAAVARNGDTFRYVDEPEPHIISR